MPDLTQQFSQNRDELCDKIVELDQALQFMIGDMGKIALGEVNPRAMRRFAVQSLRGLNLILGNDTKCRP